jgi:TolB-like protein
MAALFLLQLAAWAQEQQKLRVAILDFTNTGGLSQHETITLGNRLRSMLVKTNAFVVLERGQMDDILSEQGFQQTGCTTTECAVEMGRMLNVQKMISGTIGKLGATYTIDLSLIDVQTAQIEKSFFRDYKGEIDGLLSMMQEISNQMAEIVYAKVPPPEQKVVKVVSFSIDSDPAGATIFVNGQEAGKTPLKSKAKEGLTVTIRLDKENYKSWEKTIVIKEGEEVEADLEYSDAYKKTLSAAEKEGGSSTWLWIGGGAVLLGGAAALLLSGSSDNPEANTTDAGFPAPPTRPIQ